MISLSRYLNKKRSFLTARAVSDLDVNALTAHESFDPNALRAKFDQYGYLLIRGGIDRAAVSNIDKAVTREINKPQYLRVTQRHEYHLTSLANLSIAPSIIQNERTLHFLRALRGDDIKFVGHDSVSIGYSVPGLHDDLNSRRAMKIKQRPEEISQIRVLFYVLPLNKVQAFGVVSGSHQRAYNDSVLEFQDKVAWLPMFSGDLILFNPRLLHTASPSTQNKKMVVTTYDLDSDLAAREYLHVSAERGQGVKKSDSLWGEINAELRPSFVSADSSNI